MTKVNRARDGVVVVLSEHEAALVRQLVRDVEDLLAEPSAESEDPLEELTGMVGGERPPTDPVLARLLPDGYRDDPGAAAELRRFTEAALRHEKSETARRVLGSLPEHGGRVTLDPETADAWLRALNDVRLALGTRLGVTENTSEEVAMGHYDDDDPVSAAHQVYVWLSGLQELMVTAVSDG